MKYVRRYNHLLKRQRKEFTNRKKYLELFQEDYRKPEMQALLRRKAKEIADEIDSELLLELSGGNQ